MRIAFFLRDYSCPLRERLLLFEGWVTLLSHSTNLISVKFSRLDVMFTPNDFAIRDSRKIVIPVPIAIQILGVTLQRKTAASFRKNISCPSRKDISCPDCFSAQIASVLRTQKIIAQRSRRRTTRLRLDASSIESDRTSHQCPEFGVRIGSFPVSNQSTDFPNSWLIARRTAAPASFSPRSSDERCP